MYTNFSSTWVTFWHEHRIHNLPDVPGKYSLEYVLVQVTWRQLAPSSFTGLSEHPTSRQVPATTSRQVPATTSREVPATTSQRYLPPLPFTHLIAEFATCWASSNLAFLPPTVVFEASSTSPPIRVPAVQCSAMQCSAVQNHQYSQKTICSAVQCPAVK